MQLQKIDIQKIKPRLIRGAIVSGLITAGLVTSSIYFDTYKWSYQSPVIIQSPVIVELREQPTPLSPVEEVQAQEVEAQPAEPVEELSNTLEGEASYYSRSGCLGCSDTLTMANGQPLDDSAYTLALTPELFQEYKNQNVLIENTETGAQAIATVTDSGGFAKYNRVADLSVATKEALGCGDLCQVKITLNK